MASLNQIAQSYADSIDKPFDTMLLERIKFSIKYWRAILIRREFERNAADRSMLQSFIMPLIKVDSADSCVIQTGCKVLRTKEKIPRPINTKGSSSFNYFGTISNPCNYFNSFSESSNTELTYSSLEQFTNSIGRYQYKNGYGYVYYNKLLKYVQIEGYFEDPNAVLNLCVNSASCVTDDDEFPIGMHMLHDILRGLRSTELQMYTNDQEVKIDNP